MKTQQLTILLISAMVFERCVQSSGFYLRPYRTRYISNVPARQAVRPFRDIHHYYYYPTRQTINVRQPRTNSFYGATKTSASALILAPSLTQVPQLSRAFIQTKVPVQGPAPVLAQEPAQEPAQRPVQGPAQRPAQEPAAVIPELALAPTTVSSATTIELASTQAPLPAAPVSNPKETPASITVAARAETPQASTQSPGNPESVNSDEAQPELPAGGDGQLMPVARGFVFEENMEPERRSSSFM